MSDYRTFQFDIEKFCDVLDVRVETARKKIAFDLFAQVRLRTPIKTGRARANWDITAGEPSQKLEMFEDLPKGSAVPIPPPPDFEASADESIFIINNLPYIEPLENGHSQQAPTGMVEPTLAATEAHLNSIMASVK